MGRELNRIHNKICQIVYKHRQLADMIKVYEDNHDSSIIDDYSDYLSELMSMRIYYENILKTIYNERVVND
jgi:hypothetical protein